MKLGPDKSAIGFANVAAAARRLAGQAIRTPLMEFERLNDRVGGRVLIKPESLQRSGSFKFRGAYNRLSQLAETEPGRAVVAWSSGNHAQGVALAARLLGISATIVMPRDAPQNKIDGTRALGAEIVFYDRRSESREDVARALVHERGSALVPSYDDAQIMAGQGTVGLEIGEQAKKAKASLDALLVCCSGGGLIAGVATAMARLSPRTEVFAVEPKGFDDTARSLLQGKRVSASGNRTSICDALLAPIPGELTFPITRRLVAGGLVVTDDQVGHAMSYAAQHLNLVVEPGGAVALAALLSGKIETKGRTAGVVISGGNVDPELLTEALTAFPNP